MSGQAYDFILKNLSFSKGNLVVMYTIAFDQKLKQNPAYMLMFNLALSDLAISTVVHLFTNVGIYFGEEFFREKLKF